MRTLKIVLDEDRGSAQASSQVQGVIGRFGIDNCRGDVQEVLGVIADLDRRGRELAGCGSQFRCDRVIETPALRAVCFRLADGKNT